MLCNIALNGMESAAINSCPRSLIKELGKPKILLTLFLLIADDFVCIAKNHRLLEEFIKPAIGTFLLERGLEYKQAKTKIVHIEQGFDFLGFNFQRKAWNYKLNTRKNKAEPLYIILGFNCETT